MRKPDPYGRELLRSFRLGDDVIAALDAVARDLAADPDRPISRTEVIRVLAKNAAKKILQKSSKRG